MNLLNLISGAGALLGLVLLIVGWRGRRVGDHPHCAKCVFDLFGLPESSTECPECGNDLKTLKATVIGRHRRRGRMLAIGITLFLLCAILLGGAQWQRAKNISPYPYLPSNMLVWMIDTTEARAELYVRLQAGTLDAETVGQLVDKALAVQADPLATWEDSWGQIIEGAVAAGYASDEQIDKYLLNAVTPLFFIRDRLQLGRTPASSVGTKALRLGPKLEVDLTIRVNELKIRGAIIKLPTEPDAPWLSIHSQNRIHSSVVLHHTFPLEKVAEIVGQVPIEITWHRTIHGSIGGKSLNRVLTTEPEQVTRIMTVVDEPTGEYEQVTAQKQADAAQLLLVEVFPRNIHFVLREVGKGRSHTPFLSVRKAWIRIGGELLPLTNGITSVWSAWDLDAFFKNNPHLAGHSHADLIIRPDVHAIETSFEQKLGWLGEWVFEDVPLQTKPLDFISFSTENKDTLPSLVPARTRLLTFEEAEQPPSAERASVSTK